MNVISVPYRLDILHIFVSSRCLNLRYQHSIPLPKSGSPSKASPSTQGSSEIPLLRFFPSASPSLWISITLGGLSPIDGRGLSGYSALSIYTQAATTVAVLFPPLPCQSSPSILDIDISVPILNGTGNAISHAITSQIDSLPSSFVDRHNPTKELPFFPFSAEPLEHDHAHRTWFSKVQ